jgi:periplasmic divalent cation tolerance protein
MRSAKEAVLVTVAVPDVALASALAERALRERRAACCQTLGPMKSQYHWQGRIQSSQEWLLLLKTQRSLLPALEAILLEMHPYEVPEILVIPIEAGHAAYLDWLRQETTRPDP